MVEHFRTVADPSKVYAIQLVPNAVGEAPVLKSVSGVLGQSVLKRRRVGEAATSSGLRPDADDGLDGVENPETTKCVFFKVLHAAPGRMHTVKVPLAAGRRFTTDEVYGTTPTKFDRQPPQHPTRYFAKVRIWTRRANVRCVRR
jgi:hypothetical protein